MAIQTVRNEAAESATEAPAELCFEVVPAAKLEPAQWQCLDLSGLPCAVKPRYENFLAPNQTDPETHPIGAYMVAAPKEGILASAGADVLLDLVKPLAVPEGMGFVLTAWGCFARAAGEAQQEYRNFISWVVTHNEALAAGFFIAPLYFAAEEHPSEGVYSISYSEAADAACGAQLEAEYRKLGRIRGRDGTIEARAKNRAFWLQQGEFGAAWLIRRLRTEASVDVLDATAALLRQMDKAVLMLILTELEGQPGPELAEALIRGLRRPRLPQDAAQNYSRVLAAIEKYCSHNAPEVRQAAYETASKLLPEDAHRLLLQAQREEKDPELIEIISEFLSAAA